MRQVLTAAAAFAACGYLALAPAQAQSAHFAGGPMQEGNQCWVSTNGDLGYGFWTECPKPVRIAKVSMKKKKK